MLGTRFLNLDLTSLDPEIERTLRRRLRNSVEMRDNMHAGENERRRGENVDHTISLRDLFAPIATNFPSCIVLPPTNATHFDLKPHVIQLLPSFHGLNLDNPYSHVKKFKDICATFKFQNFSEESMHLRLFPFSLTIEPRHGWIQTCLGLSHLGKACFTSFTINFFQYPK
jgi:hypothetical protein